MLSLKTHKVECQHEEGDMTLHLKAGYRLKGSTVVCLQKAKKIPFMIHRTFLQYTKMAFA